MSPRTSREEAEPRVEPTQPAADFGWPFFVVVSLILIASLGLLGLSLYGHYRIYAQLSEAWISQTKGLGDYSVVIAYATVWDAAVMRISSLILGFVIVFVGSLYVLRSTPSPYEASLEGKGFKGRLQTSSPGLILVTLGILLITVVLRSPATIDYMNSPGVANSAEPEPTFVAKPPLPAEADQPNGKGR